MKIFDLMNLEAECGISPCQMDTFVMESTFGARLMGIQIKYKDKKVK
ncbi:MAG: hypothetical protein U9Q80_00705 [Bacillota bacterium]|nr:hypothetical protein [Bacillota bacterium]